MSDTSNPKIYLFKDGGWPTGDCIGTAIAEDGTELAGHISSSVDFLKFDLGLKSKCKHSKYADYYPGGYELVWVDNPTNHKGLQDAIRKHKEASGCTNA